MSDLKRINIEVILTLVSLQAIITIIPTVYILCKRTCKETPIFVSVQMICFNCYWICFISYYSILLAHMISDDEDKVDSTRGVNMLATFGDLFSIV